MRIHRATGIAALAAAIGLGGLVLGPLRPGRDSGPTEPVKQPNEFFHLQRAWPGHDVPVGAYARALTRARAIRAAATRSPSIPWQEAGPTNVGGRVTAIAVDPVTPSRYWIGAADGGVLRTTDSGITWTALLDDLGGLSVGALAAHPTIPGVLLCGTGEANASGDSYDGLGMLRTTDGGDTWASAGLATSRRIGKIAWDLTDPDVIHVAVAGGQYSKGPDRGVHRSTDGGATWARTLFLSDSTSAIDVVVDPTDGTKVYAAMWDRLRGPDFRTVSGPLSGIWRSTDRGATWSEMTSGVPTTDDVARIGLAVAPTSPSTVYAVYSKYALASGTTMDGVYRSTNGGDTWAKVSNSSLSNPYSSFGWYFGQIRVSPVNANHVWVLGVSLRRSTDGGVNWGNVTGSQHVDMHDLWIDPSNAARWISGNDGGIYTTPNNGSTWTKSLNLPITQFYAITVDPQLPYRIYGGTQDNSTPRTLTGALDDWDVLIGGDGFTAIVDPQDSNVIYGEAQYGYLAKSVNGGGSFSVIFYGLDDGRANWHMPVVMAPDDRQTLYAGTWRAWRTTDGGTNWTPISPDLTDGSGGGNLTFGTLTTLAVSPVTTTTIWAGSDDANVHVTTNGGTSWTEVDAGLPLRWITRVAADPFDAAAAYVSLSGYRQDEPQPHLFRTTDLGATWSDISGNLPDAPVNDVVPDPQDANRLYVATDVGVFVTHDLGASWTEPGAGLPLSVVVDLELHDPTRTLVAGTHGRSSFKLDLDAAVTAPLADAGPARAMLVLEAPRPNPARGSATIAFLLPRESFVRVTVHDVAGRRVRELLAERRSGGRHEVGWDGRDEQGRSVAAGVYLVRVDAAGERRTAKLVTAR